MAALFLSRTTEFFTWMFIFLESSLTRRVSSRLIKPWIFKSSSYQDPGELAACASDIWFFLFLFFFCFFFFFFLGAHLAYVTKTQSGVQHILMHSSLS